MIHPQTLQNHVQRLKRQRPPQSIMKPANSAEPKNGAQRKAVRDDRKTSDS
jgi:hypothetical protein